MKSVLAIDIGTGFTKAAMLCDNQREPMILVPEPGRSNMESIAYLDEEGNIKINRPIGRHGIIRNIKKDLGNEYTEVNIGDNQYKVKPVEVYGAIAREAISRANKNLCDNGMEPIYNVVVTYPVIFTHNSENPRMRKALDDIKKNIESHTIDEHKIKVVKMIPEAVAAAYGTVYFERNVKDNPVTDKKYTITMFDLGHGTLDVAVLTSTDDINKPFDVVAQAGDATIGGRFFNDKLFKKICDKIGHPHKIELPPSDLNDIHYKSAVNIKHALSREHTARENYFPRGYEECLEIEITRDEFESLIEVDLASALQTTVHTIQRAMRQGIKKIDEIVITGGSSRIKAIESMLKDEFKSEGIHVRAYQFDNAVVFGAARYGYTLEKKSPVTQHSEYAYGIFDEETGMVKALIAPKDKIPKRSKPYEFVPSNCSKDIWVCRSKEAHCQTDRLYYDECSEVWRFRFDTEAGQPHQVLISIDETHKLKIEMKDHLGKKTTINKMV